MATIFYPAGNRFQILHYTPIDLMEYAGRTAYNSRDKIKEGSAEEFLKRLIKLGHESVIEHSMMTVEFFNVSRGFTHELVRHRLASFTQQSTRYVDKGNLEIVVPPNTNLKEKLTLEFCDGKSVEITLLDWIVSMEQVYRQLREKGYKPEDARQFLPIGVTTNIVVTANYREWRHIFKLRTDKSAHWEIRIIMTELLDRVKQLIPVIFDDL